MKKSGGGMFNEFVNNADTPLNMKMLVNIKRYLTNDERVELKKNIDDGKNINKKMEAIVKRKLNRTNLTALRVSPLKLGFFNAIVNETFDKKERIDLVHIFNKKPHGRKPIPSTTLDIEIKSIKLYFGRFKVGAEHSLSGIFGEVDPKKSYFMAQISAHVYDGKADQGITFRIYRNGKIHFSGGILNNNIRQPEQIRKYIVDTFTKREAFLYTPIVYNNTVGQFNVNGALNLTGIAVAFRMTGKTEYEPELRAALRMDYFGTSYQLFSSGVVQIMGVRSDEDMVSGYERGKELAEQLLVMGLLRPSNTGAVVTRVAKKSQKKVVASDKTTANVTYNSKKNLVKIAKKSCVRYPKPELVAAAKKIGVVNIKASTTKGKICEMIKDRVFGTFMVENKPCLGYTRAQLVPVAIAKGISVSDGDTVESICEKLRAPAKAPTKKPQKPAKDPAKLAAVMEKRRLTNNAIKSNLRTLYGKKWTNTYRNVMPPLNANVAEIKRRVDASNLRKNKMGLPFKKDVDALKKLAVRDWKEAQKKKLNALNNNLAKELENLLDVVPNKVIKKKLPKGTKVEYL